MLSKWRKPLHSPLNLQILASVSSFILSKPPSVSTAASLADEPTTSSVAPDSGETVGVILSGLRCLGLRRFVNRYYFKNLISMLNCSQVDQILEYLSVENADSAVDFFHLLRNEFGFRHSRFSKFVVLHVLARKRQLKELRLVMDQMLLEEGLLS